MSHEIMFITAEDIKREIKKRRIRVKRFVPEDHCGDLATGRRKTRYRFRRKKPFTRSTMSGDIKKGKSINLNTFLGAWKRTENMGNRRLLRESLATPARLLHRARKNPLAWMGVGAAGFLHHDARRRRRRPVEDNEAGLKGVYDPRKIRRDAKLGGDKMITVFIRGRPVQIPAWKYRADSDVGHLPGVGRYDDR